MADLVKVRLLGNVLRGGLIHRLDEELELAEAEAAKLVDEGVAELATARRKASSKDS